ncbi:MAG: phosphotransferase family protein [Desulfobacteraceae bacterium]|nr:phosphotransferase family protein [Desulfobacteraceae bacterium]
MTFLDQAKTVRSGESLDTVKIGEFLKREFPGLNGPLNAYQFHKGYSNLTYLIIAGDTELVLRRPPFGRKAKSAHDMNREYRILSAINPVFAYAPEPLAFCEDTSVMEAPFYVMQRLRGVILRKGLREVLTLGESGTARLCRRWLDVLCEMHALDYRSCGLADLGNPEGYVSRQVHGWSRRYREACTDDAPDFEAVMNWLKNTMPADSANPCLIHNDYKFDNVVLDPADMTRLLGVLDWEMATVGDPLMDLGACLAYWVQEGDNGELQLIRTLPTTAPGMLTRRQIVQMYAEKTGTDTGNIAWYYCFGLFRLAVIAQQIYYRFFHGQTHDQRYKALAIAVQILEKTVQQVIETGEY